MSDYGTMVTRILDDLERDDLTAAAQTEINTAIRHYDTESWYFLEDQDTISTTASTEYYTLTSNFRVEDSITIGINSNTYPLIKRTFQWMEEIFVSSTEFTGFPTDYAIYNQRVRLYPVPNGNYPVTVSYRKAFATLSADGDTNTFMTDYEELIRAHAEARLYTLKLHDRDAADMARQVEMDAYRRLRSYSNERQMVGRTRRRRI